VAVDLAINPNTVMRAYREMEIRGILDTQQGAGTFIAEQQAAVPKEERERQLNQLAGEFVSRAGLLGFTVEELMHTLREMSQDPDGRKAETRRKS
jgi:GntR family transcriptional regulator